MGLSAAAYLDMLQALLPPGAAWTREPDAVLTALLLGLADGLARIDERAGDLVDEADPRTAYEMLQDWERVCGLPDECLESGSSLQERRAAVGQKLAGRGGQSRAYFIALADTLGFDVTITEFSQFRAGAARAGDRLTNGDWAFTWQVNAPESTVSSFRVGASAVGEPLASWGNDVLECVIEARKPAHTYVLFSYGG